MIAGLTGGIACGKSTVARMFIELGCPLIDADQIARDVVEPGETGYNGIVERFGRSILNGDGTIDRKALGRLVFSDTAARMDLNAILHPMIRQRMDSRKKELKQLNYPLIIVDIPLLYESKLQHTVDGVIVVFVPPDLQLKRLMLRDALTQTEAEKRMAAQLPIEEKKKWAHYLIDNSGTMEQTRDQVKRLYNKLTDGKDGSWRSS